MSNLPYDPEARRETSLALKLKERILRQGPITIAEYMRSCLTDPEHGYYVTRQAVGAKGDFITAPEISQVFGELIGLWVAVVWQQMGAPQKFNLVELGPGRGTMMRDALRAARIVPGFLDAASIVLVDVAPDPGATDILSGLVPGQRINTLKTTAEIPKDTPMILVANEFLDTCPVQQFEVVGKACFIRSVGLDPKGNLRFVAMTRAEGDDESFFAVNPYLRDGSVFEAQDWDDLAHLPIDRTAPWAALFIDYGYFDAERNKDQVVVADTLQAVRGHKFEHPLTSPGEADLTCQVDFNDVKLQFDFEPIEGETRLAVDGPVTQAQFLGSLGIIERTSRLMNANPQAALEIETGVARLMAVPGMGSRFKAIGVRSADLPPLPGLSAVSPSTT